MAGNDQDFNSREFSRGAVSIDAHIREVGAGKQRVSVIDLSRSGFRMHCVFLIRLEQTVYLTMPGFEPMEARVAWHDEHYYGCEFKQRIYEAVYDHVLRSYPQFRRDN